jgi:hypothetical protein
MNALVDFLVCPRVVKTSPLGKPDHRIGFQRKLYRERKVLPNRPPLPKDAGRVNYRFGPR